MLKGGCCLVSGPCLRSCCGVAFHVLLEGCTPFPGSSVVLVGIGDVDAVGRVFFRVGGYFIIVSTVV